MGTAEARPRVELTYRWDPVALRLAAGILEARAERLTEDMQLTLSDRLKKKLAEDRAKLWHAVKLIREVT
jgi:hypothetical protein